VLASYCLFNIMKGRSFKYFSGIIQVININKKRGRGLLSRLLKKIE
jgi:hypothetical protein